ncbi:MAG: hypothetical protein LC624_04815 [Halobacteriales archaeon]|nr:hypothetical protein [Halobacteriales archaeon]
MQAEIALQLRPQRLVGCVAEPGLAQCDEVVIVLGLPLPYRAFPAGEAAGQDQGAQAGVGAAHLAHHVAQVVLDAAQDLGRVVDGVAEAGAGRVRGRQDELRLRR